METTKPTETLEQAPPQELPPKPAVDPSIPKILIVDADQGFLEYMKSYLETHLKVLCLAASPADSLQILGANHDIVFALIEYGYMTEAGGGPNVMIQCRRLNQNLTMVVTSALPPDKFDAQSDAIMLGGADAFLRKPISGSLVEAMVARRLARKSSIWPRSLSLDQVVPLDEVERQYVRRVVELFDGNVSVAAGKLGRHRQTIMAMMK